MPFFEGIPFNLEELAAVTVPSFLKTGLSVGILSSLICLYSSSSLTMVSGLPRLPAIVTGTTSALKAPFFHAAAARRYDSRA